MFVLKILPCRPVCFLINRVILARVATDVSAGADIPLDSGMVASGGAPYDSSVPPVIPSVQGGGIAHGGTIQLADSPSSSKSCFSCLASGF